MLYTKDWHSGLHICLTSLHSTSATYKVSIVPIAKRPEEAITNLPRSPHLRFLSGTSFQSLYTITNSLTTMRSNHFHLWGISLQVRRIYQGIFCQRDHLARGMFVINFYVAPLQGCAVGPFHLRGPTRRMVRYASHDGLSLQAYSRLIA